MHYKVPFDGNFGLDEDKIDLDTLKEANVSRTLFAAFIISEGNGGRESR